MPDELYAFFYMLEVQQEKLEREEKARKQEKELQDELRLEQEELTRQLDKGIDWVSVNYKKPVNQSKSEQSIYTVKDEAFRKIIDDNLIPSIHSMTKQQIHDALIKLDAKLWISGFSDWWKHQEFIKLKAGRKKNKLIE